MSFDIRNRLWEGRIGFRGCAACLESRAGRGRVPARECFGPEPGMAGLLRDPERRFPGSGLWGNRAIHL
jgi:hypothetical protein